MSDSSQKDLSSILTNSNIFSFPQSPKYWVAILQIFANMFLRQMGKLNTFSQVGGYLERNTPVNNCYIMVELEKGKGKY